MKAIKDIPFDKIYIGMPVYFYNAIAGKVVAKGKHDLCFCSEYFEDLLCVLHKNCYDIYYSDSDSFNINKIFETSLYARLKYAQDVNVPVDILAALSKDENECVRYQVALNPKTPKAILAELSKDKDSSVRLYVAHNTSTPSEILANLSKDERCGVRYNVARNPNTSKEILEKLSWDEDYDVRFTAEMRSLIL